MREKTSRFAGVFTTKAETLNLIKKWQTKQNKKTAEQSRFSITKARLVIPKSKNKW